MTTSTSSIAAPSQPASEPATNGRMPSHSVYHVRDIVGREKGMWTRIGSAWPHADGKGFNVQVECVPLDGRLSLRIISEPTA